jgi:hypothetical protein
VTYTASVDKNGNKIRKTVSLEEYTKATLDDLSDLFAVLEQEGVESKTFSVRYNNVRLLEKLKEITAPRVNIVQKINLHESHHQWFEKHLNLQKHKWLAANEEMLVSLLDMMTVLTFRKSDAKSIDTAVIAAEQTRQILAAKEWLKKTLGSKYDEDKFNQQVPVIWDMQRTKQASEYPMSGGKTFCVSSAEILKIIYMQDEKASQLSELWGVYEPELKQLLEEKNKSLKASLADKNRKLANMLDTEEIKEIQIQAKAGAVQDRLKELQNNIDEKSKLLNDDVVKYSKEGISDTEKEALKKDMKALSAGLDSLSKESQKVLEVLTTLDQIEQLNNQIKQYDVSPESVQLDPADFLTLERMLTVKVGHALTGAAKNKLENFRCA